MARSMLRCKTIVRCRSNPIPTPACCLFLVSFIGSDRIGSDAKAQRAKHERRRNRTPPVPKPQRCSNATITNPGKRKPRTPTVLSSVLRTRTRTPPPGASPYTNNERPGMNDYQSYNGRKFVLTDI
mmetsp:Transcript_5374/g.11844  ORF Transcript_5374/g.11844 Transcript_5374/m.11844 type:complete len:126 (+) Transcript_5374:950-1327(+)